VDKVKAKGGSNLEEKGKGTNGDYCCWFRGKVNDEDDVVVRSRVKGRSFQRKGLRVLPLLPLSSTELTHCHFFAFLDLSPFSR